MAKLVVVPTPIGNLDDMTFRGIKALKEADLILAEDTRTTSVLLKHFDIQKPMRSHHKGFLLVRECVRRGVDVECLPGATAFVPALVDSGLPNDRFCFEGFLPQKKGRQTRLKELSAESRTMIIYESPFRLVKTLTQFIEYFGEDREVSVSREISKIHEETVRGSLKEVVRHFTENEPRGEIVIIVSGLKEKREKDV